MSQTAKFVKDLGLVGFMRFLANVRGIVLLPILTKALTVEQYGIWNQVLVGMILFSPIALLGAQETLVRFLPQTENRTKQAEQLWSLLVVTLAAALLIAALLLLAASPIHSFLQLPSQFIPFLGLLVVLQTALWTLQSVFQAFRKNGWLSVFLFAVPAGEITLVSLAIGLGYGLVGALVAIVLVRSLLLLLLLFLVVRELGITMPRFITTKQHLAFGIPLVMSTLSYGVVQAGDTYIISALMGVVFVGYYAPAYAFGLLLNMLIIPMGMLLSPLAVHLFTKQQMPELQRHLTHSLKYLLFLLIPAAFGLGVLAKQLLQIFSTTQIADNAFFVVPFIASSFVFHGAYIVCMQPLYLFHKTRVIGFVWGAAAFLNIALNILLIPFLGLWGAAGATLIAYAFVFVVVRYTASKYLMFPIDWISLAKSIGAASLMALAIFLYAPAGLLEVLLSVAGGIALYFVLLFFMRALGKKELRFVKSLL